MSKYRVITISREFGSGGRLIGVELAKRLGITYYDKEIIGKVGEETGFSERIIEDLGEHAPVKSIWAYAMVGRSRDGFSVVDSIYSAQVQIIKKIAEEEPCVIVGRNADSILEDREDVLNVFIQGELPEKLKRVEELTGKKDAEAKKLIKETDKKRRVNYEYCTSRKWGVRENYDVILNTSAIGYEACIDILEHLYKG
ncbi:MAG: cytidylate kinase-like family protein [Lachnospiraceae bacterium]|nr:cytidylate kinase-like family protein [Lachnospiraceae bacterium]